MKSSYVALLAVSTLIASANVVEITEGVPFVEVEANGKTYKIQRVQEEDKYLTNTYALTSRPSPPFLCSPLRLQTKSKHLVS